MPIPAMPSQAVIRRPFGGPGIMTVPCRVVPALWGGRSRFQGGWQCTHYMDVPIGTDVRHGMTRTAGLASLNWSDGDEVRVKGINGYDRYVVAFSTRMYRDTPNEWVRVWLLHDSVVGVP